MGPVEDYLRTSAGRFGGKAVIVANGGSSREFERAAYSNYFVVYLDDNACARIVVDGGPFPGIATERQNLHNHFNVAQATEDHLQSDLSGYKFSVSVLVNLLAAAGFSNIDLAGLSDAAQDHSRALLGELRTIRDSHDIVLRSARCERAFVLIGGEPEQSLAEEVLKWSIDSNTILTLDYLKGASTSRDMFADNAVGTPFSFQRLFLPHLAGHRGRGAYFDSDMLVFRDVFELFDVDMGQNVLLSCKPTTGRPAQYSVFVVDNARARWDPDEVLRHFAAGTLSYAQIMQDFCFADPKARTLPMEWNSLEQYEDGQTANCHFTDMDSQPWLSTTNPHAFKWCEALFAACNSRPSVLRALETSLEKGWVRPSLKWQVEQANPDPRSLPHSVKTLDDGWSPPHKTARRAQRRRSAARLGQQIAAAAARIRQFPWGRQ